MLLLIPKDADMRKMYLLLFVGLLSFNSLAQEQVYELRAYELNFFKSADLLHNYLSDALIPALNRQGSETVGVFEDFDGTLPSKIYVLIPYASITDFQEMRSHLESDEQYQQAAQAYLEASADAIPFGRIESTLIQSSYGFPELQDPEGKEFLELRIYTSHNEAALSSKLKMFNEYEFPIFEDAGLDMIFFGVNLVGGPRPSLTYLLATETQEVNAEGWGKFINHPEWKRITALEEFQGNMNNIHRVYLKPLSYSQL